ncbi:hypothetical protein BDR03DRAFT_82156 [Suillus americanus]|nr:hypothetical protein BDR03DRAFT_82156 [Suillus americanus]
MLNSKTGLVSNHCGMQRQHLQSYNTAMTPSTTRELPTWCQSNSGTARDSDRHLATPSDPLGQSDLFVLPTGRFCKAYNLITDMSPGAPSTNSFGNVHWYTRHQMLCTNHVERRRCRWKRVNSGNE